MSEKLRRQIRSLTDTDLTCLVGSVMLERGRNYLREDRVTRILDHPDKIVSTVKGNGRSYMAIIRSIHPFDAICTCPVGTACKHIAAILLAIGAGSGEENSWHSILDALHKSRQTASRQPYNPQDLAIVLVRGQKGIALKLFRRLASSDANSTPGETPTTAFHTASSGSRPNSAPAAQWTQQRVAWNDFSETRSSSVAKQFSPHQLAAMRDIVSAARRSNPFSTDITLEALGSSALAVLRDAAIRGIYLFWEDSDFPLTVSDQTWSIAADISHSRENSDLNVRFIAAAPGGERAEILSDTVPPLGVARIDGQFVLAAVADDVARPLAHLAKEGRQIEIPADERAEFEATFLPALEGVEVISRDKSYEPLELSKPRLHIDVDRSDDSEFFTVTARQEVHVAGDSPDPGDNSVISEIADYSALSTDIDTYLRLWAEEGVPGYPTSLDSARLLVERHHSAADLAQWGMNSTQLDMSGYVAFRERLAPRLQKSGIIVSFATRADFDVLTEAPSIETRATEKNDWLDLEVVVRVRGHEVPLPILYEALARGVDFITFGEVAIPLGHQFDALRQLLDDAAALGQVTPKSVRVPTIRAHALEIESVRASQELQKKLRELEHLGDPEPLPKNLHASMREYQKAGYAWLTHLARAKFGGVLADDMGLGKTLQVLAVVQRGIETGAITHPVLIVAPTSVVSNWRDEAQKFTPNLRVTIVQESSKRRELTIARIAESSNVVVTSYTLARLDSKEYRNVRWSGVVVDEAQAIKNPATASYKAIAALEREWTFAVTGTPVENSLGDLAALLYLTAPGLLPNRAAFAEKFRKPIEKRGDSEAAARLQRLVHPFLMRRRKDDVATDLPEKNETVLSVELDVEHSRRYRKQLERERQEVLGLLTNVDQNRISILASLTRLRRLAIDPALVTADNSADSSSKPQHRKPGKNKIEDSADSAKTELLIEHLQQLLPEGHQVLVFSQFTTYLERIAKRLKRENIAYSYLDGGTRDREGAIEKFRSGVKPVFLISLKAGGTGLNLVEADYVYIMDPWWNPAAEEQAIDRTHRIGQDKRVMVYRLVSRGTIEEKVVDLQEKKRNLAGIIDAGAGAPITAEDMRALLTDKPAR